MNFLTDAYHRLWCREALSVRSFIGRQSKTCRLTIILLLQMILLVFAVFAHASGAFAALADANTPVASITLQSTPVEHGLQVVAETDEGKNVPVTKAGRPGWQCTTRASMSPWKYMYFRITDDAFRNGKTQKVKITIDYFDEGNGAIALQYDSLDRSAAGAFKSKNIATLSSSGAWKTAAVTISDAQFAGRCNGNDFRLIIPSQVNLTVGSYSLRVYKIGRLAKYKKSDLDSFIESRLQAE
jgi:hypothetical protein